MNDKGPKLNIYLYLFEGGDSQLKFEFLEPSVRRTPRGQDLIYWGYCNIFKYVIFLILLYHYNCGYLTKANTLSDPFQNFRKGKNS